MNTVELVFRSVGERTTELALELAKRHLGPERVHVCRDVRPFVRAFRQNLEIPFTSDYVVFMDADCLILEDLRPFLAELTEPYVDCYVIDKFRGRLHAGLHITHRSLVEAMRRVEVPDDDPAYLLRPESYTRMLAMRAMNIDKSIRSFRVLHDFGQSYADIYAKYVLRAMRSKDPFEYARLEIAMSRWPTEADMDFAVARHAVDYTREHLSARTDVEQLIADIPAIAAAQLAQLKLPPKPALTWAEVDRHGTSMWVERHDVNRHKVFGIGLSRTGTKSLTRALNILGLVMSHYPTDALTYRELSGGNYKLTLLDHVDGITDITLVPFFREVDALYPGSKFILSVRRDKAAWLRSLENHWANKPIYDDGPDQGDVLRMKRFLRAAVYGTLQFNGDRLSNVYDRHTAEVLDYFRDRPNDLLVLDITAGEGWPELCRFLHLPTPTVEFPNVQTKHRLRDMLSRAV